MLRLLLRFFPALASPKPTTLRPADAGDCTGGQIDRGSGQRTRSDEEAHRGARSAVESSARGCDTLTESFGNLSPALPRRPLQRHRPQQVAALRAQPTEAAATPGPVAPFSDADWSWLNGNARTKDIFWDSKFFTPEIRADTDYVFDFNHPTDHSIGGSSELFRSQEVQVEQIGVGGDFHYDNVRARLMTQFGMYSVTTPRNDPSPGHGQWDLADAYRYVSEAYWRISLQRIGRDQRRRGDLHVVYRPFQLLQFR